MPRGRPRGVGIRAEYGEFCVRQGGETFWRENFSVDGHRFRKSLGTDRQKEAELRAARRRLDALEALEDRQAAQGRTINKGSAERARELRNLTVGEALALYLVEVGQYKKTADDIRRLATTVAVGLGEDKRLIDVGFRDLANFIATRRMRQVKDPANPARKIDVYRAHASINREVEHFRTVMRYAAQSGARVPVIEWTKLLLDEPESKQTILSQDLEAEFFAVLRPDYHPLVLAALSTGQRLDALITLKWRQVDLRARTITLRVKSKKPGGKLLVVPLTASVMAILGAERAAQAAASGRVPGQDAPVFTYVCQKNRHDPHTGRVQERGKRYRFTKDGWRREWDRARRAIGLPQLRFHDLRHTAATRTLAATGNLKTVQKMLGHSEIATTARYLVSEVEDVRAAMEAVERARLVSVPQETKGG